VHLYPELAALSISFSAEIYQFAIKKRHLLAGGVFIFAKRG